MDDSKWSIHMKTYLLRIFEKSNIFKYFSTCQTRSDDFWILNAMCMFMYLFVAYFSFAPVISASTHRHCELFHIQVLMMVAETETLTSTLHHDIFTYLDYILSCNLHTVGFFPYLLSYIYIYIYIYSKKLFAISLISFHLVLLLMFGKHP